MALIEKVVFTTAAKIILLGAIIYYALEDGKVMAGADRLKDLINEKEKEFKRGKEKQERT